MAGEYLEVSSGFAVVELLNLAFIALSGLPINSLSTILPFDFNLRAYAVRAWLSR